MKRLFLIMFAFATLAILSSCSRKAPDVWLMPDCNQSCQEFTNFIEELTPLKCKEFEGSDQNLCHILVASGVNRFNMVAVSEDDLDDTKIDSLKGRPVYQFSGLVPGQITLYDGLSQEQFKKHCFENLNNNDIFSELIAEFDDLSDQDIEKIRAFISKYIEITNKVDALEIRKLQTENLNKHERREIFENEFGINYNNIDKEKKKFVDEIREASDDLPDSLRMRYSDLADVGSAHEQGIFLYLQAFYTYITLKSKYSSSSKILKNKPELLKDIESFSNAYFNRLIRCMHAEDTHIDDDHKKEIREHILSAVMAFVISEDRLPTSNEEIMSTLYLSMPIDDLERIAKDLQNYSMLTNEFSGIKFSKNDFEKNLRCLSPLFSFGLGKGAHFSDIAADYKGVFQCINISYPHIHVNILISNIKAV